MEQELEDRLRSITKEHLLQLIQELMLQYPLLQAEIATILDRDVSRPLEALHVEEIAEGDGDFNAESSDEEWDFGSDTLAALHPVSAPVLLPLDHEMCRQRIDGYLARLQQGEPLRTLAEDLDALLDEAETRAEHHDFRWSDGCLCNGA